MFQGSAATTAQTAAAADPNTPLTLEQKIVNAVTESEQVIAIFNPGIAALVNQGVAIEPILSVVFKAIFGIFHKHVTVPAKPA